MDDRFLFMCKYNYKFCIVLSQYILNLSFQSLQKHGASQKLAKFEIPKAIFLVRGKITIYEKKLNVYNNLI